MKKLKKTTKKEGSEYSLIYVISNEACKNYKEEALQNPTKKEVLSWWREIKNISKKKIKTSS